MSFSLTGGPRDQIHESALKEMNIEAFSHITPRSRIIRGLVNAKENVKISLSLCTEPRDQNTRVSLKIQHCRETSYGSGHHSRSLGLDNGLNTLNEGCRSGIDVS